MRTFVTGTLGVLTAAAIVALVVCGYWNYLLGGLFFCFMSFIFWFLWEEIVPYRWWRRH